ncbi:MAG: protein phosphatase CheZ [Beijerinckiaceae bacterium]
MAKAVSPAPVPAAHAPAPLASTQKQLHTHIEQDLHELRERMAAVIAATNDAAMMIIGTVESTFDTMGPSLSPALQERLFSVLSACAFQDITGQHLARMAELLNDVQACAFQKISDETSLQAALATKNGDDERRAARLISGPALWDHGLGQSAVDALIVDPAVDI